jgi:predicted Fe-Mo cluster-binding NifX family protein
MDLLRTIRLQEPSKKAISNNIAGKKKTMKICITSQGESVDSAVDSRFGRAAWFIFYDESEDQWESFNNAASVDAAHGAGTQAAQKVVERKADVVLTGAVGPKAFKALDAVGVKVYHGAQGTIKEALAAFKNGQLQLTTIEKATGGV